MNSIIGNEYLPNLHIDKIIFQPFDGYQRVKVFVSLYDYNTSTWSSDEKFTSYFTISCFMVWDKNTISSLNEGQTEISTLSMTGGGVLKLKSAFSEAVKSTVSIRGQVYKKFKKEFNFIIPQNVSDLSCYCVNRIEIEQLKDDEGLNLSYAPSLSYMGSVKSEKILENNSQIENSFIFRDQNNEIWSGPVHRIPTGAYMAGSEHGIIADKYLSIQTIQNSKIEYLDYVVDILGPTRTESVLQPPTITPFFYQEEFVEDRTRNVSSTTIADLENILLQESKIAEIMYRYDKSLFAQIAQITNIKTIEINRFPIIARNFLNSFNMRTFKADYSQPTLIARSNNNHRKVKHKTLLKISPTEIVSVDMEKITSNPKIKLFNGKTLTKEMIKNARKIGKVEQLNLSLPSSLRAINFTDYDVQYSKQGRYRYQIKLSLEDEHLKYCKKLLKDLTNSQNKIQNLYNVLNIKNVFNGEQFKIQFLQEFYSQYNIAVSSDGFVDGEYNTQQLKDSYLIKSFEYLQQAEKLVGTKSRAKNLIKNLNLFSTDLDKIQNTAEYFSTIIDRFKSVYDLSDGQSFDKSSTSSRKDRGLIEKTINLKKQYERKLLQPIGINFINLNISEGLPTINLSDFSSRASKEINKFFVGGINSNSEEIKSLPEDIRLEMLQIEQNKYMDFSPAKIFFGNREVDTTEINPESFDVDFFNDIRIAKSALKLQQNVESDDNIDPSDKISEEQLNNYLDSREMLGDTTKFNNLVFSSLIHRPMMIPKIRKKFKLLDNKILKSKKKNISLDTFDLKQPNNIISAKLKTEPKNVPIQLKALSLLRSPMTKFDLNTIQFDPLSNPQTQEVFEQNYLNIGKVQTLEGFERINGRFIMNKPIYKEINSKMFENLKEKNVLCRIVPQNMDGITTDHETLNIHDKVFVLKSVDKNLIGE